MAKGLGFDVVCLVAALALLAGGCTTIDPYTGERKISKAAMGSAIGAATGAAIGAISGDDGRERRKRALIGAGAGALAGGAVGYYMDVQEAKLRERLEGTGVSVTRVGDDIVLNMPGNVTFSTGSSDLRPQFFDVLNSVALVFNEYERTLVEVAGHTDSTGSAEHNLDLSQQRASSVSEYLRTQGVAPMRLARFGYGEARPIASNETTWGRQQNRRVELTVVPVTR